MRTYRELLEMADDKVIGYIAKDIAKSKKWNSVDVENAITKKKIDAVIQQFSSKLDGDEYKLMYKGKEGIHTFIKKNKQAIADAMKDL